MTARTSCLVGTDSSELYRLAGIHANLYCATVSGWENAVSPAYLPPPVGSTIESAQPPARISARPWVVRSRGKSSQIFLQRPLGHCPPLAPGCDCTIRVTPHS